MSNLTAVVNGLGLIKQDLSNVDSLTRQLQETALQLDAGMILYYFNYYHLKKAHYEQLFNFFSFKGMPINNNEEIGVLSI